MKWFSASCTVAPLINLKIVGRDLKAMICFVSESTIIRWEGQLIVTVQHSLYIFQFLEASSLQVSVTLIWYICILQKSTFCVVTFILWLSSLHSISLDVSLRRVKPAAHHVKYNLAIKPCLNAKMKFQVAYFRLPSSTDVRIFLFWAMLISGSTSFSQLDIISSMDMEIPHVCWRQFSSSASNWKRKYLVNITPHKDMSGMFSYLITVSNFTILFYFWKIMFSLSANGFDFLHCHYTAYNNIITYLHLMT